MEPGAVDTVRCVKIVIRSVKAIDKEWLETLANSQAGHEILTMGNHRPSESPGFIAQIGDDRVGLISYAVSVGSYEIIMISSSRHGLGIGRALVNSVIMEAKDTKRTRVTTTAKLSDASTLTFFKGCGFTLSSVMPGGNTARMAKTSSAVHAASAAADEIELEFRL